MSDIVDLSIYNVDLSGVASKEHTHTKSEITDLTVSDSITSTDSRTYTLTDGAEFFSIEYDGYSMKFHKTDNFDADILGSTFNIIIGNIKR